MKEILCNSAYFGVTVSLIGYGAGIMLKKKFKYAFLFIASVKVIDSVHTIQSLAFIH